VVLARIAGTLGVVVSEIPAGVTLETLRAAFDPSVLCGRPEVRLQGIDG